MSNYGPDRLNKDRHIERQYYANTLRVNMLALVLMTNDKYPWASEEWKSEYPHLSRFLNNAESEYGETEEDYFNITTEYHALVKKEKWLLESLHDSFKKHLKKYIFPRPNSIKTLLPFIITLAVGVFLGWLLF